MRGQIANFIQNFGVDGQVLHWTGLEGGSVEAIHKHSNNVPSSSWKNWPLPNVARNVDMVYLITHKCIHLEDENRFKTVQFPNLNRQIEALV
jgi:hypothetical protein